MRENIKLNIQRENVRVRFQCPTISANGIHASIPGEWMHGRIQWEGVAGDIRVTGICRNVCPTLWHLEFVLQNSGADQEVRFSYPYHFYHLEHEKHVRILNPVFGGVLETLPFSLYVTYPGRASFCLTACLTAASGAMSPSYRYRIWELLTWKM